MLQWFFPICLRRCKVHMEIKCVLNVKLDIMQNAARTREILSRRYVKSIWKFKKVFFCYLLIFKEFFLPVLDMNWKRLWMDMLCSMIYWLLKLFQYNDCFVYTIISKCVYESMMLSSLFTNTPFRNFRKRNMWCKRVWAWKWSHNENECRKK